MWMALGVAGCQGTESMGSGGMEAAGIQPLLLRMQARNWPDQYVAPTNHQNEKVSWYLAETKKLVNAAAGIDPSLLQEINWGLGYRGQAPHPGHTIPLSWLRVQTAYWHAVDGQWVAVASKLGHTPGVVVNNWANQTGNLPAGKNATSLLNEIDAWLQAGGHYAAPGTLANKAAINLAIVLRRAAVYPNQPQSAWIHLYLAHQYAGVSVTSAKPPGSLIVDWTICELIHDS